MRKLDFSGGWHPGGGGAVAALSTLLRDFFRVFQIPSGPGELDLCKERKPSETSSSEIVQCDGRILSNFLIKEVKLEMSDGGITDGLYTEEK